jgi:hypothetical protein
MALPSVDMDVRRMTEGDLVHAARTVRAMSQTEAKAGGWLANYYLRGLLTLVVIAVAYAAFRGPAALLIGLLFYIGMTMWASSQRKRS